MSALLERLLEHRAIRSRLVRPAKLAKRPDAPNAAEKAYVADLHRLVIKWGEATKEHILPNLDTLAKARKDHAPTGYNEFVVLSDNIDRLTRPDVIVPLFQKQADRLSDFKARSVARSMGIDSAALFANTRHLGPSLDSFITDNTSLIKTLSQDYVSRIADTLSEMQGERSSSISNRLQYDLDVTESHADLIAVDQTLKLNSKLTELRQTQVGVTAYAWFTVHDERVRPDHAALDGQHFSWSAQPPIVDRKTGRREHPGRDFRCRCQAIAIIPGIS